jgi:hypothetical protein
MVQPAKDRMCNDSAEALDRARVRCILTPFDAAHIRQINIGFECKFLLRPRSNTDRTDTATGRSNACI